MSSLLALDLGSTTGYVVGTRAGVVDASGTRDFRNSRFDGGGMRLVRFRGFLFDLYHAYPFDAVYFEEVRRHRGVDAAHLYGGFMGTLTAWCEDEGDPRKPGKIPYEGVPVGAIKRFATGRGNASKTEIIRAMKLRGYDPADDNEADALALFHLKAPDTG